MGTSTPSSAAEDAGDGARGAVDPAALASFVGRDRELAATDDALAQSRLVTLTGAGGIGKTRLAREVLADVRARFRDGSVLVELAALHSDDEVAEAVVETLGLTSSPDEAPTAQLASYLTDKQFLLVLDNCEHVLAGCRRLVTELLAGAPDTRVLTTSREVLAIVGERVVRLSPLRAPTHPDEVTTVAQAREYPAVQLLEQRARAASDSFRLDRTNVRAAAEITARLDGLPLAIELAAVRLRTLSPHELTEHIDDRFTMLTRGDPTHRTHHQTLHAMVEWSWDLCSDDERRLWAVLSVFSGGADLEAIRTVAAPFDGSAIEVVDELDGLVAKSIVLADTTGDRTRYTMLETLVAFGAEHVPDFAPANELATRHARYYLGLAAQAHEKFYTADQLAWTRRLRSDRANLAAAFDHLLLNDPVAALELATALRYHWITGPLDEGRRWLEQALVADADPVVRLDGLMAADWVAVGIGDRQGATRLAGEIERLLPLVTDPVWTSRGRLFIALTAQLLGDLESSARTFEELISPMQDAGDVANLLILRVVHMLGMGELGDAVAARAQFDALLALCDECGEQWVRSYAGAYFSFGRWLAGDVDETADLAADSLRAKYNFDDQLGIAMMLRLLGGVAFRKGDAVRAATLIGAADAINRRIGATAAAYSEAMNDSLTGIADEVHEELGPAAYGVAYREGGAAGSARMRSYAFETPRPQGSSEPAEVLTARELEVAGLVTRGLSNRMIAEQLVLSPRTIDGHLERILAKLGFRSRAEVAAWVTTRARET